jgi:hypothetical protein
VDREQALFNARNELVRLRDGFDQTLGVLRKTGTEFTSLVRCFANLGKCAEEFDDQQLREALEGESEEARGLSFGDLKRTFNFSGERFELLTLEFGELARVAESSHDDTLEVISIVDDFIRSKDELVRRVVSNLSPDEVGDEAEAAQAAYLHLLSCFVDDVGLFLEHSQDCFSRVLESSQGNFQQRINELIGHSAEK